MSRKRLFPRGPVQSALGLTFVALVVIAALLRGAPTASVRPPTDPVHEYPAVAAAIGLAEDLPRGAALATYIYASAYGAVRWLTAATHPGLSPLDFCAGFARDPVNFTCLARTLTAFAGVAAVGLVYVLLARLVDPWAGLAGALMLAIHPGAIAISRSLTSDAFCLVCLLGGLVVFIGAARGSMRLLDFLAAGLLLGFASETLPVLWLGFPVLLGWLLATSAPSQRLPALQAVAVCAAAFALATLTIAGHLHILLLGLVQAGMAIAAVIAGIKLLRHLHDSLPQQAWSRLILSGSLAVSVVGLSTAGASEYTVTHDCCAHASEWIVSELAPGTTIAVDVRLADRILIPRTARSWRREYALAPQLRPHSPARIATGVRTALIGATPAFDVIFMKPGAAYPQDVEDLSGALMPAEYIVLPDDPHADGRLEDLGLWMVARFHATTGPGVVIWGTRSAAPPSPPPLIPWHINHAPITS